MVTLSGNASVNTRIIRPDSKGLAYKNSTQNRWQDSRELNSTQDQLCSNHALAAVNDIKSSSSSSSEAANNKLVDLSKMCLLCDDKQEAECCSPTGDNCSNDQCCYCSCSACRSAPELLLAYQDKTSPRSRNEIATYNCPWCECKKSHSIQGEPKLRGSEGRRVCCTCCCNSPLPTSSDQQSCFDEIAKCVGQVERASQ